VNDHNLPRENWSATAHTNTATSTPIAMYREFSWHRVHR
jgi:hypothetical protein